MLNHTIGKYTIEIGDDKNYIVTKKGSIKPAYYNSLPLAVKEVARRISGEIDSTTLEDWVKEYDRVLEQFAKKVERFN